MSSPEECVLLRKQGRLAIITLNIPSKLNAMNGDNYYRLSCLMQDVAKSVLRFILLLHLNTFLS